MRKEKQLLLDEIQGHIQKHGSFVIMSYLGLSANEAHKFRSKIREMGGSVEMVPRKIFALASDKSGIRIDLDMLTGHIGVVFSGGDPIETTKTVYEYQKEADNKIAVIGGRIDGSLLDKAEMQQLSQLPGKQELRAQFVGLLQAPMAHTVSAMNAIVSSVVYCLDNKCKKEEG